MRALVITSLLLSLHGFARSDLPKEISGVKFPNSPNEGTAPVVTEALIPTNLNGYTEQIPYLLGSPIQEDAGSCLYMTITGNVEWWLARKNPHQSQAIDGPLDLSERHLMNLAGIEEANNGVENWKTDTVEIFNRAGQGILNRDYRYTKGWYKDSEDGQNYIKATKGEEGASYGTPYNWIDELDTIETTNSRKLPQFDRKVIFADPNSNQWNVAVAPADIVAKVKKELLESAAPVQVIYNHYGYWHAVMIVGYDDHGDNGGCDFTKGTAPYLKKRAQVFAKDAAKTEDKEKKERLEKRAKRYHILSNRLTQSWKDHGGCGAKGTFYVRDSLYPDPEGATYDYDQNKSGEERKLGKKVILREYEWLHHLSNHIYQIYPRTEDP